MSHQHGSSFFYYERSVATMARRQRECYLCGEPYQYCPTCSQDRTKPVWMTEFHKEDCMKIFDICTRFNLKLLSKADAQEMLIECDLSNKENFKSYVQKDLENIFEEKLDTFAIEQESHEVVIKEN
jgi:hypothetical protein